MKKFMVGTVIGGIILLLGGCASTQNTSSSITPSTNVGQSVVASSTVTTPLTGNTTTMNHLFSMTTQDWYVVKSPYNSTLSLYEVYLKLSGTTNAQSIAVRTIGNGLLSMKPIVIKNGKFNDKVVIAFYMLSDQTINPNYTTSINVVATFADNVTETITLNSPVLDFKQAIVQQ